MQALILTPDFPPRHGGIQTLMHRVATHMTQIDTCIVTLDEGDGVAFDRREGLDVVRVRTRGGRLVGGELNLRAVAAGLRIRPDIVVSGHVTTVPAAAAIKRMLRVPVALYAHAQEIGHRPKLSAFGVRTADLTVAVSRYTHDLLADLVPPRLHERIRILPPGCDPPPPRRADKADVPTVVVIARLQERYKGHDVLIRAMPLVAARVPRARLVIVGDGPLRRSLEQLVVALHAKAMVEFVGAVDDNERDEWLDRAHVFAMPSRLPAHGAGEGFGIVYLEAGLHHLPVVAAHEGGALDAVIDGITGTLVEPLDHVALADALVALLVDPSRANAMGAAGFERAMNMQWPEIVGQLERWLLELARKT